MPVDLNADLGEGFARWKLTDDAALLAVVTSASVACGYHAGDAPTMHAVCSGAAARGIAVGAQVSYNDLVGFGRRRLDVHPDVLLAEVIHQIGGLQAIARACGTTVSYVKPHGALYAAVVDSEPQAGAVIEAVLSCGADLVVLGAPGSRLLTLAEQVGLRAVVEAFPDRGYAADGRLLPRGSSGALLTEPQQVAARAVRIAVDGLVDTVDGPLELHADSLCVHGDSPGAAATARAVRTALEEAGLVLRPFAPA